MSSLNKDTQQDISYSKVFDGCIFGIIGLFGTVGCLVIGSIIGLAWLFSLGNPSTSQNCFENSNSSEHLIQSTAIPALNISADTTITVDNIGNLRLVSISLFEEYLEESILRLNGEAGTVNQLKNTTTGVSKSVELSQFAFLRDLQYNAHSNTFIFSETGLGLNDYRVIRVCNLTTGETKSLIRNSFSESTLHVPLGSDETFVILWDSTYHNEIKFYEAESGDLIYQIESTVLSNNPKPIGIHPDKTIVAVSNGENTIMFFGITDEENRLLFNTLQTLVDSDDIKWIGFNEAGTLFIIITQDDVGFFYRVGDE